MTTSTGRPHMALAYELQTSCLAVSQIESYLDCWAPPVLTSRSRSALAVSGWNVADSIIDTADTGTGGTAMTREGSSDVLDALARRAQQGDAAALDAVLEQIDADGAIRIPVRKMITNSEAVEDVCQDVLIIVAERIGQWEGRSSFRTWLNTIAHNKSVDYLRRQRPTEGIQSDVVSDQQRVSSLIATRVVVNDVLAQLPDHYRDPVTLRDIEQHDYDEIARMLDLPPATVRTRVSRGRAMVAARWARSTR